MNKQKQNGSALVVVTIVIAVAIIATLAYVLWNNHISKEPPVGSQNTTQQPTQSTPDLNTYENTAIGITFTYPRSWINLSCENHGAKVYFATDNRGIDNGQLCGGGSDFPAQMTFARTDSTEYQNWSGETKEVRIDGVLAVKHTLVAGDQSIYPSGFKTTAYVIKPGDNSNSTQLFTYNKWPQSSDSSYDTSDTSEAAFIELVEKRLKLI